MAKNFFTCFNITEQINRRYVMRINTEYNNHKSNVNFGAKILATDATLEAFKYAKELLYSNNKEKFLVVDKFCKGMDKALNFPSKEKGFVNYVGKGCIGFGVPACPKIISTNYKLNAPWQNAHGDVSLGERIMLEKPSVPQSVGGDTMALYLDSFKGRTNFPSKLKTTPLTPLPTKEDAIQKLQNKLLEMLPNLGFFPEKLFARKEGNRELNKDLCKLTEAHAWNNIAKWEPLPVEELNRIDNIDRKNIKEFAEKHVEESIIQDEINEKSQFSGNVNKFKFLNRLLENFAPNSKHAKAIEEELYKVREVEHKYLQSLKDRLTPVKSTDNLEPKNKYSYFISTSYENLYKENGIS